MSKIAGELNAEMTNAVRDKYRVLFAEMVRKTGSNQSVLDRLVQEIHSLREQVSELEASPLSEEALDILRSKNKQLEAERDHWKANHDNRVEAARLLIERTDMPLERVKAYKRYMELAAQNEALREALEEVKSLIGETAGVYGLHLNGDLSPWAEIEQGGRFERLTLLDDALNLPNLAAEVLKRRDAETLRRAADRFEAVDPHPKHWDWLRRNAAEIEGDKQ